MLAHDVDDFSKIWQAMGRSRTMNETRFSVYKSDIPEEMLAEQAGKGVVDIKAQALTRQLYVHNCDSKMAGNLSSIYQTLISLFNLSQDRFYYMDEIVNVFIEKMERTIADKVRRHEAGLARAVLGAALPLGILTHILGDKFRRSASAAVAAVRPTPQLVQALLSHVVQLISCVGLLCLVVRVAFGADDDGCGVCVAGSLVVATLIYAEHQHATHRYDLADATTLLLPLPLLLLLLLQQHLARELRREGPGVLHRPPAGSDA